MGEETEAALLGALQDIRQRMDQINDRLEESEPHSRSIEEETANRLQELRDQIITKEHLRKRRHQAIFWAAVVAFIFVVSDHATVTKCFLSPNTGWSKQTCGVIFPGYAKARAVSIQRTAQFTGVLQQIPQQQKQIADLQLQVHALEQIQPQK